MIDWNEVINYALIIGGVIGVLLIATFLLHHGVL